MLILTYIVSIIVFCIAAWILPLPFLLIVSAMKGKDEIIAPTHLRFLAPFIVSTIILLYLTRAVWANWGYSPGWLFPTIIAVLHLVMGEAQAANRANQAQAYGVVFGVIIYAVSCLF